MRQMGPWSDMVSVIKSESETDLCPKAQVQEPLALCGAVGGDLNHTAVLVAGDDVDSDAQEI